MNEAQNILPKDWKWVTLEDVAEGRNAIVDSPFGSNLKTSDYIDDNINGVPVLTTKNLEGDYSDKKVRFISKEKFEELKRSQVNPGDILVAKIGSIGKTGIYPKDGRIAIIPANLLKFTVSKQVEFNYVYFYINSRSLQNRIKQISTATAQPAFNVTKFRKLLIPLPPKPTQQAIVSKIEELFSELDKGIEQLKTAQQQLKIYRQSVLKWAFEGKLTEEWRLNYDSYDLCNENDVNIAAEPATNYATKNNKGNQNNPANQGSDKGELPKGWRNVTIDEVAKVKGGKRLPKGHSYSEEPTKHIYIRVADFENQTINQTKLKYLFPETQNAIKNYIISKNDVYISIAGTIGVTGTIPDNLNGANLTENAAKITELKEITNKYLSLFLSSYRGQSQINIFTKTTTQPKLSLFRIQKIELPLPLIEEQNQIVQEIESRLSVADKMEESITQSLQQSEALRQSILKKAFEGRLV